MSTKLLKEYNPNELLLNKDIIKNVMTEYAAWQEPEINRAKYKELTLTLAADILLNLIALAPSFDVLPNYAKIISVIILAGLCIYTIICATKWAEYYNKVKNRNIPNLEEMMIARAKESMKYTAISRVTYKEKGQMLYLVGNDYFLPHCNMDKNLAIDAQEKIIIQNLQKDFNIKEADVIEVIPVDGDVYYSIKPIHGSIKMNAFVFYDITIKEHAKDKLIQQNNNRRWISIDKMKKTTDAMSTNKDVIELLEDFPAPKESFVNLLGDLKIIWNITSKCPYNCNICATFDAKRTELNANDKLKVLNSVCSAKHMIKNLDFAGGDPLHFDESTTIIQSAIEQLGKDKVSITTTGQGISTISDDEFLGTVKHCEVTIDASHENLKTHPLPNTDSISRNEKDYSSNNIENIYLISNHADYLTINIPIINDDLSDVEIDNLVSKISWIKAHTSGIEIDASLIRLMPVGKLSEKVDKNDYTKYNPISVAKKIEAKLREININCKLHCSLRTLSCFGGGTKDNHCSMLENKLGIDCEGNVFACAWGGYLQSNNPPTKNPFYLGNLTKVPLLKILNGKSRTTYYTNILNEIENKNYRNFCSVVSYYENKELFKNYDPLAEGSLIESDANIIQ